MSVVAPSEDVAMVPLGKDLSPDQLTQSRTQEQSSDDAEATLPWDRAQHDPTLEMPPLGVLETDARPSPEGSIKEAVVGSAMEHQALLKPPEDREGNGMPAVAAHVFVPIDPLCIERPQRSHKKPQWQPRVPEDRGQCEKEKDDPEKQTFITQGCSACSDDLPGHAGEPPEASCCQKKGKCSSANLKAVASMSSAMIIFPCLIYGAYIFLPFDVPTMATMSSRLVYTLRCGVFATFPIILGMIVYGVSRLCSSSLQPFEELRREVEIHRHYVSQSVHLFILYFFNIAVLSTYLPQEGLKLIPLLTALFAISRLLYWLAFAMGRSFRGFGLGLTFLPLVAMLLFNLYSMFLLDTESMFATASRKAGPPPEKEQQLAASRPRYWG